MSNPTNNNGQGANWQPGDAHNVPGNGNSQSLPPYQQGQSSTPYTTGSSSHEQTTISPEPAKPVRGEVTEPVRTEQVRTERVETRPTEAPATSVGKKSGFKWWWLLPLLLLLLLIPLLWPKHPAPAPSPSATTTVATASPTMTASASRTATPSASASSSASASASANPFADMDKVTNTIGVNCGQWTQQSVSNVSVKTCTQGTDAKFAEIAGSQQQKLDDTFWKTFGGTYPNPGSYVVTDKSKFGFLTGSSKEEADAIAKQTQLPVYKITANGLENA